MVTTPVMRMIMATMTLMSFDINIGAVNQPVLVTVATMTMVGRMTMMLAKRMATMTLTMT